MGTFYNCLTKAVLTSTHNLCFEQKYEKYQSFLCEIFQFLEVKFSIYLYRRIFVMGKVCIQLYDGHNFKKRSARGLSYDADAMFLCLFFSSDFLYKSIYCRYSFKLH